MTIEHLNYYTLLCKVFLVICWYLFWIGIVVYMVFWIGIFVNTIGVQIDYLKRKIDQYNSILPPNTSMSKDSETVDSHMIRYYHSGAAIGSEIYIHGSAGFRNIYIYNPYTNLWTRLN